MKSLPALDAHAHISPRMEARSLESLGAVVLAATRSLGEFETTLERRDLATVWGVGTHPGLASALTNFNRSRFERLMDGTPLVSEVGLDGAAANRDRQSMVFQQIANAVATTPRVMSVHSRRATDEVLDILESSRVGHYAVLHWWLGSAEATARAVDLGAFFSVNQSMQDALIGRLPVDRVLLETDHPYGDRATVEARPGNIVDVERRFGEIHGLSPTGARTQSWVNFATLASGTRIANLLPTPVQRMLIAATT
jgi:TatD DNase family protein